MKTDMLSSKNDTFSLENGILTTANYIYQTQFFLLFGLSLERLEMQLLFSFTKEA